jgi:hypothetical protein
MQYGKPAATAGGFVAGNTALALTGFRYLLWAEVALLLIVVGLILWRVGTIRKQQ